ncbi:hypothetical protein DEU37_2350 [Microbacterium sp. AG790]|nr:hypothetical protein DEU37_2350 [Microbacterium sp. AG790]
MAAVLIYASVILIGLFAGASFALFAAGVFPAKSGLAGSALSGVVLYVSVLTGPEAPGSGPAAVLTIFLAAVFLSPVVRAHHPALAGRKYWRRLWLILLHDRAASGDGR